MGGSPAASCVLVLPPRGGQARPPAPPMRLGHSGVPPQGAPAAPFTQCELPDLDVHMVGTPTAGRAGAVRLWAGPLGARGAGPRGPGRCMEVNAGDGGGRSTSTLLLPAADGLRHVVCLSTSAWCGRRSAGPPAACQYAAALPVGRRLAPAPGPGWHPERQPYLARSPLKHT